MNAAPAANAHSYAPHNTPMSMAVKVRTTDGHEHRYEGLFRHTFDAWDDAIERFGLRTARIFVTVTQPRAAA